ncbi:hypothetical protein Tco_0336640 [Tanacetum coccineum]
MVPSPSHTVNGTVTVTGGGGPVAEDIFLVSVEVSLKPSSTARIEDVKFAVERLKIVWCTRLARAKDQDHMNYIEDDMMKLGLICLQYSEREYPVEEPCLRSAGNEKEDQRLLVELEEIPKNLFLDDESRVNMNKNKSEMEIIDNSEDINDQDQNMHDDFGEHDMITSATPPAFAGSVFRPMGSNTGIWQLGKGRQQVHKGEFTVEV